jgi:hypothetical protein
MFMAGNGKIITLYVGCEKYWWRPTQGGLGGNALVNKINQIVDMCNSRLASHRQVVTETTSS